VTAVVFLLVAAAATVLRAVLTSDQPRGEIPWRTFVVNVAGALLLGLVVAGQWFDNPVIVAIAGLGSLTTFSTVAAETGGLLDDHKRGLAIAYVVLTIAVGVAAASLGLIIGDSL
jgi:CrcB protein